MLVDTFNGNIYTSLRTFGITSPFGCGGPNGDPALGNVFTSVGTIYNRDHPYKETLSMKFTSWVNEHAEDAVEFGAGCARGVTEGVEILSPAATAAAAEVPGLDIGEGALSIAACLAGGSGTVLGVNVFNPSSGG